MAQVKLLYDNYSVEGESGPTKKVSHYTFGDNAPEPKGDDMSYTKLQAAMAAHKERFGCADQLADEENNRLQDVYDFVGGHPNQLTDEQQEDLSDTVHIYRLSVRDTVRAEFAAAMKGEGVDVERLTRIMDKVGVVG